MNYLLTGRESFNLKQRKNQLIEKLVGKDNQLSVSVYSGFEDVDIDEVIDDCNMIPFLSDNKVVVLENPKFLTVRSKEDEKNKIRDQEREDRDFQRQKVSFDKLIDYLKNPHDTTTLIIVFDSLDTLNRKFTSMLTPYLIHEKFDLLSEEQFKKEVIDNLKDNNVRIDKEALKELLNRLPNSLENWQRELDKLTLYPGTITIEVIENLISQPLEDNAFELTNALFSNDLSKALSVLNDLTVNRIEVFSLIGLISASLRMMTQVLMLIELGKSDTEIASMLNISSGRLYYLKRDIQNRSCKEILKVLNDLSQLDQDIKSGRIDGQTGLELFIIKTIRG
ncbi:MAG: DNA polymerase III subunit delta [Bacillota bacterium]|jgi:DNA polymerase-3 subunit delta|nr:DNA polymerase III subunit delta [Bacillota bacterium]NLL26904.1 DNA polymerase III subunit delta [Erysipelotrichia bacterium]